MESLPTASELAVTIEEDLDHASPDAILAWGREGNREYDDLLKALRTRYPDNSMAKIDDPALGEVGTVVFIQHSAKADLSDAGREFSGKPH